MLSLFAKKKSRAFAKQHFLVFVRTYAFYQKGDYAQFLQEAESWLTRFPNHDYESQNNPITLSNDPYRLTCKNDVFFSNTLYLSMAVSAYILGEFKKSMHYRHCMSQSVAYSFYSGVDTALAWRYLNLSMYRDALCSGYSEYLKGIREIDAQDLSSVGAYGDYYFQVPTIKLDMKKGEFKATYPGNTDIVDFRTDGKIKDMFERIADWIVRMGIDYDWAHNREADH